MSKTDPMTANERAISERVKTARKAAGLSQAEVALKLGPTIAGYGHYKRGRQPFSVELLIQLARVLNRPLQYFLGLDMGLSPTEEQLLAVFRALETERQRRLAFDLVQIAAGNKPPAG